MSGESTETGSSTTSTIPGLEDLLGYGQSLVSSSAPWQPYTGSTVTPYSTQTMSGLTGAESTATGATTALNNQLGAVAGTTQNGGLSDLQQSQVNNWNNIVNSGGMSAEQRAAYNALAPTANGLNAEQQKALNLLNPIASGSTMAGNPYLDDMIKKSADDIRLQSGLAASSMGRYGSGGHEGVQAKAIGDMSTDLRYQNYMDEAARRDQAVRDVFGMGSTGSTQRTNAIGQQAALATTGQQQAEAARQSLYGAGQQGIENTWAGTQALLDAYNASLAPYQTLLGVGGAYEDLYGQTLADQQRIFEESQAAQTAPLDWLAQLVNPYGTTTTTQSAPDTSASDAASGALSTYALTSNPYAALLGGLAGYF